MRPLFDTLMELKPADIRLDCAALQLARDVYPHIEIARYTGMLDQLAERVADLRPGLSSSLRYEAMREVLVDDFGLTGNTDDYYDPENSFLNRVLDRRRGVPITVSLVWMEVGRRLKWPVQGAAYPGHFLVRFDDPERFIVVDPFRNGQTLTEEDCQGLLDHCFDGKIQFRPSFLEAVGTRTILARILNNLRAVFAANQSWGRLEWTLQRLAALEPHSARHVQEIAALRYRRGDVRAAYAHLQAYVSACPANIDTRKVVERMTRLEADVAALN